MAGGVPAGRRVPLPKGAQPPYEVYVNGVLQREGDDYGVRGPEIVFTRQLYKEGKLSSWRWIAMGAGLFGSYGRNDTVDVQYHAGGHSQLASNLPVLPD
jgi:hypothetical protein